MLVGLAPYTVLHPVLFLSLLCMEVAIFSKHSDDKETRLLPAVLLLVAMLLVLADPAPAAELLSQIH